MEADRDDGYRQMDARSARIEEQVDLSVYGVTATDIGGVRMWGVWGSASLHMSVEAALAEVGFGVIIDLGGRVFVEPWR